MRKQQAIFWNRERNILSINFRSSRISYLSEIQQKYPNLDTRLIETDYEMFWRRHFTDDLQSFLASVRTLELRMRGWDNKWKRWLKNGPLCKLKDFVGLKELRVVGIYSEEEHALITRSLPETLWTL
jgi:hypothetical protein